MDELTIGDKTYISSKRAAQITGYAKDYVGQLCREGRVEARLVGRSWYVLEDAIRAHRFGDDAKPRAKAAPVEPEPAVQDDWEPAVYKPEPVSAMPEFTPRPSVSTVTREDVPVPVADIERSETLTEMQAAWHEWFTRKEELLLEEHNDVPSTEASQVAEVQSEEEVVPITRAVPEEHEIQPEPVREETVFVHKSYTPSPSVTSSFAPAAMDVRPPVPPQIPQRTPKQVHPRKREGGGTLVLKTFFAALAIIAVAVTIIGSGYADKYMGQNSMQFDYFRGASTFERESK